MRWKFEHRWCCPPRWPASMHNPAARQTGASAGPPADLGFDLQDVGQYLTVRTGGTKSSTLLWQRRQTRFFFYFLMRICSSSLTHSASQPPNIHPTNRAGSPVRSRGERNDLDMITSFSIHVVSPRWQIWTRAHSPSHVLTAVKIKKDIAILWDPSNLIQFICAPKNSASTERNWINNFPSWFGLFKNPHYAQALYILWNPSEEWGARSPRSSYHHPVVIL